MEIIPNVTQAETDGIPILVRGRPAKRKGRKPTIQPKHIKAAQNLLSGNMSMGAALVDAGFSKSTARIPGATIRNTPAIIAAIQAELSHYGVSPQQRALLIRQRLVKEVLTAKSSDAIRACEVAGKDKEVRLFEPETVIGVFAVATSEKLDKLLTINNLSNLPDSGSVRQLSAECPPADNSTQAVDSTDKAT